jgi:hypothetical protein
VSNDLKYRYPGAYSFSTEQKALFFGRETPIKELYPLVRLEQLIVLYGKSGLGKTSLINAGILPLVLEEGSYEPISIRFNAWTKGKKETPSDIVRAEILKNISTEASFLPNVMPDDGSFWYAVKTRLLSQVVPKQPLFIFDQFEELFTYPDDSVRVFAQWFSELLLNELPQRVRRMRDLYLQIEPDGLTEDQLHRLNESPIPKALISIRSDRMSLLDKLTGHVPHILDTRYELQPLDDTEAEEAIVKPADTEGVFASKEKFTYAPAALKVITNYLTNQNRQRVESFQLQIVCQSVEQTVIKQKLKTVQVHDLGDLEKIFENYYEDSILGLDTEGGNMEVRSIARRLIEDKLVLEKEQRRLSVYEGQLLGEQGVDENLLVQLVNARLLRREISRLGNGFDYELSHDTLVAPVLKARKERIEKEKQESECLIAIEHARLQQIKEAQKQKELEYARAAAKKERRRRQISNMLLVLSVLALAIAVWQYFEAQKAKEQAVTAKEQAETALNAYKTEEKMRKEAETINEKVKVENLKTKIKGFIIGKAFDLARDSLQILERLAPNDVDIKNLKKQIQ